MALYLTEALISKGNHSEALNELKAENEESKLMPSGSFESILTGMSEDTPMPISAVI